MNKNTFIAAAFVASASVAALPASATVLTLDQGRTYSAAYDDGGMGSGRGFGFRADQSFDMTALAIDLNVEAPEVGTLYEFEVYSSTDGHSAGSLLGSTSFTLGLGAGYQDQMFSFSFDAGTYYVINFSRFDDQHLGGLGTKYSWEDPGTFVPFDYGVLTMIEGFEGASPNPGNPLIPHMRITFDTAAVPEPGTLALLGLGLAGLGFMTRRRKLD